jgi:RimJ/RimL family protein N-acetyltransferase
VASTRLSSSHVIVPVLETERLRLRGHRPDDFADDCAMWSAPEVVRHIGGQPSSPEVVWSRMIRYAGLWAWLGFGYWVLEDRATGRFVGEAGFADFRREMTPSIEGLPEIGWALAPWAHGRGLATEAVRAIVDWGDEHFGERPTVCIIDPDNRASIRIAEKCGYREREPASYRGETVLLLQRGQAPGA